MKKKLLISILLIIYIFENASAASNYFYYDNDNFANDSTHTSEMAGYYGNVGLYAHNRALPSSKSTIKDAIKNENTVFISSHGNPIEGCILLRNNVLLYPYDITDTCNSKLVFLSSCGSACDSAIYGSMCSKLVAKGVLTAVGYSNSVNIGQSRYIEKKFFYYFAQSGGHTAGGALTYSIAQTYAGLGSGAEVLNLIKLKGLTSTKLVP